MAGLSRDPFRAVAAAMKLEADGVALRLSLMREIKREADPLVRDLKKSIESAPAHSSFLGAPLRQGIADKISAQTRFSGRSAGASVRARKTNQIRGFNNAARTFQQPSWRHQVYGRGWTSQTGKPRWFDDTTKAHRSQFEVAVIRAVAEMDRRLAHRSRGL